MFLAHLQWRADNGIDTILTDFHFGERDAFLSLYPQGYHKTDKLVRGGGGRGVGGGLAWWVGGCGAGVAGGRGSVAPRAGVPT